MYNCNMKIVNITEARKNFRGIIEATQKHNEIFVVERHDKEEAIIMKFPTDYSVSVGDITNVNAYSSSFDFLADEPDIYTYDDIKKSV